MQFAMILFACLACFSESLSAAPETIVNKKGYESCPERPPKRRKITSGLPILPGAGEKATSKGKGRAGFGELLSHAAPHARQAISNTLLESRRSHRLLPPGRSEERRVGKECRTG